MLKCFGREGLVPTTLRMKRLRRRCSCCCCCHRCCRCRLCGGGPGQLDSGFKCKTQPPCLLRHQRAAYLKWFNLLIALTALDRRREAASSQNRKKQKHKVAEARISLRRPAALPLPTLPVPPQLVNVLGPQRSPLPHLLLNYRKKHVRPLN